MAIKFLILIFTLAQYATSNILIPCTSSEECDGIVPTSFCNKFNPVFGYCSCPAKFTFNSDVSKCVPELPINAVCEDSNQCSHMLTGARCNANGRCECSEGFSYFKGQCRKFVNLHEQCQDDIDCQFSYFPGSAECKSGICECADGFYQRSENICRIKSFAGEPCVVHTDCVDENHLCTRVRQDYFCLPADGDASNFVLSVRESHVARNVTITNNEEADSFGETCDNELEPCDGLKYSTCSRGLCQCQRGFYESGGVCKAEIGMAVDSLDDCGFGLILDSQSRCSCDKDFFAGVNFRTCKRSTLGIQASCNEPSECSPYGAAYCTALIAGTCQCFDYSIYNPATELCELKTGLTKYCDNEDDCAAIPDSICSANRCICDENYIDIDGACRPSHNAKCSEDSDCGIDDSECVEVAGDDVDDEDEAMKVCRCKKDFTVTETEICGRNVESVDESCDENEQCWALLGEKSTCVEGVCGCHDESLHQRSGKCYDKKYVGEQCMTSLNCYIGNDAEDATECRNGFCQCKIGKKFDEESQKCLSSSERNSSARVGVSLTIVLVLAVSYFFNLI